MNAQRHQSIQVLQHQAASLLIYQSVLHDSVGQSWLQLLDCLLRGDRLACATAYGRWFSAIAAQRTSWQDYLIGRILRAENPFTQQAQSHPWNTLPKGLVSAVGRDLRCLHALYRCTHAQLGQWMQTVLDASQPAVLWEPMPLDGLDSSVDRFKPSPIWARFEMADEWDEALVAALAEHHRQVGVGILADSYALRWQAGDLIAIANPDPIRLAELVGYEVQKQALLQNTEALLAGYRALHVLLYGSRGTGKSSLVKGLLYAYGDRGLRLIEVSKSDLRDLPMIAERLRGLPQSFILFVDDLSFEEDEDAYKALKVVLEGNLTARPANVVVYATSNRRHLIREFFGDRPRPSDADEIHAWDTVQEKLSFSDRFGLTLTFEPANQTTYLEIVHHLAHQAGLSLEPNDLEFRALQWATRHNGRSGRTARQFIDFLQAELQAL